MKKQKVYVVHGYTASSKANWFPWLKDELEADGIEVVIPDLPESSHPYLNPWLETLKKELGEIDDQTVVIGHSLGCITVLRYLLKEGQGIKGAILVSGFSETNPMIDQSEGLQTFVEAPLDYCRCKELSPLRVVITAVDDDIVPTESTRIFAQRVDAELEVLQGGKHFIDRDGFVEFPLVLEWVKRFFQE